MFINVSMYIEAAYYKFKFKLLKCDLEIFTENSTSIQSEYEEWFAVCDIEIQFFFNNFNKKGQKKRICFKFSFFILSHCLFSVLSCHSHSKVLRAWCQTRAQKKKVRAKTQQQNFHLEMLLFHIYP